MYIFFLMLFATTLAAQARLNDLVGQETYVIDSVCIDAVRNYRINGWESSTYKWNITNEAYDTVYNSPGTPFLKDSIHGSEIEMIWDTSGTFLITTIQYSIHGCDTIEAGKVKVFDPPFAFAGNQQLVCTSETVSLYEAIAENFRKIEWTSTGDGVFDFDSIMNPVYTPGIKDSILGNVNLIITTYGLAENSTCLPAVDTVDIWFSSPLITLIPEHLKCYNDFSGEVKLIVTSGNAPYNYKWTGPNGYTSTNDTITGLEAGWYKVLVTDSKGCQVTDSVLLTQPDKLLADIDKFENVSCFGGNNGSAHVTISGGTSSYFQLWNSIPAQMSPTASNLTAGKYVITITDFNDCVAKDSIIINEPDPLVLTADSVDAKCMGGAPGSVDLTVYGGTPYTVGDPYRYEWRDEFSVFASTEDIDNLAGDMLYTVVVTDSLGCMDTLSIKVNIEQDLRFAFNGIDSILCYGETGSIHLNIVDGAEPYDIKWDSGQTSESLLNVPAGNYHIVVTDASGCSIDTSFVLTEPDELIAGITSDNVAVCEGNSISLNGNPVGGTGSYTHSWTGTGANYLSTNDIENPVFNGTVPGNFELIYTVTDENGCITSSSITLDIWPVTYETVFDTICPTDFPYAFNDSIYNSEGDYEYITTNMYGCDSIITLKLSVYDEILLAATPTNSGVNNEPIGAIDLQVTGGTAPFAFTWSSGETTEDLTELVSGIYDVTVTDAHNCSAQLSVTVISEPGNAVIDCPPEIKVESCADVANTVYNSYAEYVAVGGSAGSTCGINESTFSWGGDEEFNGPFCVNIRRTYLIQDSCGSWVICVQNIFVDDRIPPVMSCPPDRTLTGVPVPAKYSNYTAYVNAGGYAVDECEIDKTTFKFVKETSDGNTNPETITRTYQIADVCGNISQCDQVFTIFENSLVNMNCPDGFNVQCPEDLPAAYNAYAEFVAAGGSASSTNGVNLDESSFLFEGEVSDLGSCPEIVTRTYSIKNENGESTYCDQTITIRDTEKPILTLSRKSGQCIDDVPDIYQNKAQFEAKKGNSADDNCELDWSTFRFVWESRDGTCPLNILRMYEIKDICGNPVQATETIIIDDKTKPSIIRPPKDIVASCEVPAAYPTRDEYEKYSGGYVSENCNNGFYTLSHSDKTITEDCPTIIERTYFFTDICGNQSFSVQKITVNDTIAPTISCPEDVFLDANLGDLGKLTGLAFNATGNFIPLSDTTKLDIHLSDNCGIFELAYADSVNPGCPALVTRTFTVYDKCGNYSSCQQLIEITQGIIVSEIHHDVGPSTLPAGWIDITVVDGVAPFTFAWTGPDGFTSEEEDISDLYAGEYTVKVTDNTDCETTLIITLTNEDVLAEITCPPTIKVGCNTEIDIHPPYASYAEFEAAGGSAESNCGIDSTTFAFVSQDTIDGIFCLTIERTYSIEDSCGNERTCEQLIIVNDPEPPVISCPGNVSTECLSDLNMNIVTIEDFIAAGGTLSDNCGIDSASFTINKVINRLPGQSEIRATYIIKDLCGNTDSCTQILISTDTEPPLASCTDITVYLDEIGKYILNGDDIGRITANSSDNCTNPEDLIIDIDITEFDCEDLADDGVQVKILISDEAGNETECTANITVLDTIPPEAICKDITVYLDENGTAGIITADVDNGSGDNCSLDNMSLSKYQFDCNDVGENEVILTVSDNFGLVKTCTSTVTVIDSIPPVVNCVPPFEVQLDENAQYSLNLDEIHLNSYDECGIDELYLDIYDLDCSHIGTTPVTLTAVDVNGNSSTCQTEITVFGNLPPEVLPDSAITLMNVPIDVDVAANDYDTKTSINLETLEVSLQPRHGIVKVNTHNGVVTYTPEPDYVGFDTLTYEICDDAIPCVPMCGTALVYIKVLDLNNPPVAEDDYFTSYCGPLTGTLLDNDYDPDGNEIQIEDKPVKLPIHGTVFIENGGSFTYIPDEGFNGIDSFAYRICDDGLPSMCDTAMVYIEKFPDNDCDGISDWDDIDDDDDGILDVVEMDYINEEYVDRDSDGDGVPDRLDIDSDNDGIVDNIEGQGEGEGEYILPIGVDGNGNGWDDAYDPEMGGYEFIPVDTDDDGMPDYLDIDSENDHVFDFIEGHDINADGIPDVTRVFLDSDNDGLDDIYDTVNGWTGSMDTRNALGSNAPLQDFDGDGIRDWRDTNDENDEFMTENEDINNDGDYSNDDLDLDGFPEYLDKTLDCELFIPEGFSPNDDGVHDFFQILCIQKYPNAHLMIFNRNGDKLFDKEHYGNMDVWGTDENAWWWGISENRLTLGRAGGLPAGNYVYVIELGNGEVKNGTVMIAY